MDEPPVKLLIRRGGHGNARWRFENEWPIARTHWTKLYLEPHPRARRGETEGGLVYEAPRRSASVSYSASGMTKAGVAAASWTSTALAGSLPRMGASFETAPLKEDTEVTGKRFECPSLIRGEDGRVKIDRLTCVDCGLCLEVCGQGGIYQVS